MNDFKNKFLIYREYKEKAETFMSFKEMRNMFFLFSISFAISIFLQIKISFWFSMTSVLFGIITLTIITDMIKWFKFGGGKDKEIILEKFKSLKSEMEDDFIHERWIEMVKSDYKEVMNFYSIREGFDIYRVKFDKMCKDLIEKRIILKSGIKLMDDHLWIEYFEVLDEFKQKKQNEIEFNYFAKKAEIFDEKTLVKTEEKFLDFKSLM